jgi:acetylornithine deacetylase/succinyl-diaminopimelate desuccinylase-like protein
MLRLRHSLAKWALGTSVALACCVLVPHAAAQLPPQGPPQPAAQAPAALQPEVAQISDEAQKWLTDLVKINTTNPPGNEMEAAKYVAAILQKENIPSEVVEIAPGRGVAIGRLQAGPLPDASQALLLVAHLDVVGVDRNKWSVDPFGAITRDGYLYGRGVIDDKGMVVANLATIVALKRSGAHLRRDLIFLADDDEEQSGSASIKTVIEKYWDKIACAYALNEGGRVILENGKVQYVCIQTSEKVMYNVAVIATGTSGHGSVPLPDNAVVHLAAAIGKIGTFETPVQPDTVTRRYFEQLAPVEDEETGKWMRAIEMPERLDLAVRHLGEMNPVWNSMLRDSIVPTEPQAGVRANVIPSEAQANLNVRLLPGNSIDADIAMLRKLVDDPQISFRVEPDAGQPAPPSSLTSELYALMEKTAVQQFPGAVAVPMLSTGATDSAELRLHNVQAYGLLPFPMTEGDVARMHADDERLPTASFRTGLDFYYRIVHDFVAPR